ncbi:MAG: hypothetical protein U1F67_15855 [Rubrivivax sp.]
MCAACHVRGHRRFAAAGRGDESGTDIDIDIAFDPGAPSDPRPHGGFVAAEAFADSRFCAGCHQFLPDGPRVAGKLQEDTVAQWQGSGLAAR